MDPRHPELVIPRMGELIEQYDRILRDIRQATVYNKLGELEREGSLVVQEICLVAPRLHEAMMQASRNRRYDLAHGVTDHFIREATPEEAKALDEAIKEIEEKEKASKSKKKTTKKKEKKCQEE